MGPGDEVLVPSFTFVATANAVVYLGAEPVFVDSSPDTWTMDPGLVADELDRRAASGRLPAAVVTVDLYGQACDYDPILAACARHGVPVVEDAAEALGATYRGRPAGSFGRMGVFSFNGNKIITTSGGGMLVTGSADEADRARFLATQAREPSPHYEHTTVGYNYRLSNLLAALGRAQLAGLDGRIERRRAIHHRYRAALDGLPGVGFLPVAAYGEPNYWLTCMTIDPSRSGTDRETVRLALESHDIESRPTWKPLHLQPVFAANRVVGGVGVRPHLRPRALPAHGIGAVARRPGAGGRRGPGTGRRPLRAPVGRSGGQPLRSCIDSTGNRVPSRPRAPS